MVRENLPTLGDAVVVILGKEGEGKREVAVVVAVAAKLLMSGETVLVLWRMERVTNHIYNSQ